MQNVRPASEAYSAPLPEPRYSVQCPLAERVIASGTTHVDQPSEGRALTAHVSRFTLRRTRVHLSSRQKRCLWHGQLEHLKFCFRETVQLDLISRLPSCITFPSSRQVMLLAFPVLGLRQPPAQERVFLCVRG